MILLFRAGAMCFGALTYLMLCVGACHSQQILPSGAASKIVREDIARSLSDPIFMNPKTKIADEAIETLRVYNNLKIPLGDQVIRTTNEPCAFCIPMDPRGAEDALIRLKPLPTSSPSSVRNCANSCHPQNPSLVADYHLREQYASGQMEVTNAPQILAARLSSYLSGQDYTKCKRVFEKHSQDIVGWLKSVREDDMKGLGSKGRAGLKDYVAGCFRQMPASSSTDGELKRIADRVGQFSPSWREILGYTQDCHGLINNKKLVTALHCFLNAEPKMGETVTVSVPHQMVFKTLAGSRLALELCEQCNPLQVTWTNSGDVIEIPILNTASLTEIASADIPRTRIQVSDQLVLFGYSPYERLLAASEGREPLVMKDDTALCSAFDSRDKIVVHGCQTGPGISGAPIFVRRSGQIYLSAVHTGATDALPVPMKRWSPTIANYGVLADAL